MGLPMAKRLLTQDYPVLAYNRTQEKSESLKTSGARITLNPLEAIRHADCVGAVVLSPLCRPYRAPELPGKDHS